MVHVINLVTSSSPNSSKRHSSPRSYVSPVIPRAKSSLSRSVEEFDIEAYEKFKLDWRRNRLNESGSGEDEKETEKFENSFTIRNHFKSPIGTITRRRTSDSFKITPTKFLNPTPTTAVPEPVLLRSQTFKNKNEAINSVRLYMSNSMAEAYESELRRRFTERQMNECVAFDISNVLIQPEVASFRWKFHGRSEFLDQRLFVLDSETLWDDYIATKRFKDLLLAYNEPNIFLYFINWKRAAQRHSSLLNRQFKLALNTSNESIRLFPANELENEFFLTAAQMRLQINFSGASNAPQSLVDLMDFLIEMTRVVALNDYLKENGRRDESEELNLTLARDVKVKSGKDARDCWIRSLCQIPRVTVPLAEVIAVRYPTFSALMDAYEGCSDPKEAEELLADLRLEDGGNRRIGPVISSRIYNHFQ